MADNDYRSYRSRDSLARNEVDPTAREGASDPLAELARLIGQSDPYGEVGEHDRYGSAESGDDMAAPGVDWAADDGYAEQHAPAEERYVEPPPADSFSSYAPPDRGYDNEPPAEPPAASRDNEPPAGSRFFSGSAAKFNGFRDEGSDYQAADDTPYRDERQPVSLGRQAPAFSSAAADDRHEADEHEYQGDHAYAAEDYYDEAPRRRSGFVVVMAVLGLAVLGTAGAFGYRAMFGASMLPTLPPIIKAGNGPNKIMPSYGDSQASSSSQAAAMGAGSAEKLVSREEQPVDIQQPASTAPRVISTIPISPGPNAVSPSGMPASPAAPAPVASAPAPVGIASAPAWPPPFGSTPAAPPPAAAPSPAPTPAPAPVSAEPKKIHTVTIRANQSATDAAPAPPPSAPRSTTHVAASAPKPSPAPAPPSGGNAPLSLVPAQEKAPAPAAPPRARTTIARTSVASAAPAPVNAAASSSGGYAVQVTSQRSEAEAQAAFRELRSKFPNQLGGREPIVRRADLGAKGVYYRALIGPFASMEAAAGMCSSLKAAGGNCLVQRD